MRKIICGLLLSFAGVCSAANEINYFAPESSTSYSAQASDAGIDSDFLPANLAFKVETQSVSSNSVNVKFTPAPGYYFYKTKFEFKSGPSVKLNDVNYPSGIIKDDPTYGSTEVYESPVELNIPFTNAQGGDFTLSVSYQGCAEAGLCYPKERIEIPVSGVAINLVNPESDNRVINEADRGREAPTAHADEPSGALLGLALFFLAGIGLAFTPCVLPMIPIMSAVVLSNAKGRARSFVLSLSYVIGMAISFTTIGALMGVFGAELNLQARVQSPWIIVPFGVTFIILGIALYKSLNLQVPSFIITRLNRMSAGAKGGSVIGAMTIGAVSAVITSPCVSAPLAGALLYIGQTGDVVRGAANLMMLALGMGLPLIAFAVGGGWLIPKAGQWMESVKNLFAAGLIAFGFWFLGRVVPDEVMIVGWATMAIYAGYALGAVDRRASTEWARLKQATGLILLIFAGTVFFITFKNALDPVNDRVVASKAASPWTKTTSYIEVQSALEQAKHNGKPVILDWYADWCTSCKIFEKEVLRSPEVIEMLKDFTLIKYDITESNPAQRQALTKNALFGPPATLIYGANGKEITSSRVVGEVGKTEFMSKISEVIQAK